MKRPKGMLLKTLQRCRKGEGAAGVAPEGCLVVRVGPERERFVIRARWVNHPLFRGLLEEAERELGFGRGGGGGVAGYRLEADLQVGANYIYELLCVILNDLIFVLIIQSFLLPHIDPAPCERFLLRQIPKSQARALALCYEPLLFLPIPQPSDTSDSLLLPSPSPEHRTAVEPQAVGSCSLTQAPQSPEGRITTSLASLPRFNWESIVREGVAREQLIKGTDLEISNAIWLRLVAAASSPAELTTKSLYLGNYPVELCKVERPTFVKYYLWLVIELAVIATPIRKFELLISILVFLMVSCYFREVIYVKPPAAEVMKGKTVGRWCFPPGRGFHIGGDLREVTYGRGAKGQDYRETSFPSWARLSHSSYFEKVSYDDEGHVCPKTTREVSYGDEGSVYPKTARDLIVNLQLRMRSCSLRSSMVRCRLLMYSHRCCSTRLIDPHYHLWLQPLALANVDDHAAAPTQRSTSIAIRRCNSWLLRISDARFGITVCFTTTIICRCFFSAYSAPVSS
ncbi:hypothetical protein ZIOFF_033977 [Zingiber officinale]|uniref:Uncharacterized protein n=1 Tax=Zingiber officinale TaxID=94328 RepID=A0A8J5GXR9_ZINOF|nr:hypothetical protein ZIOFF_033977 [Zingiber officinale]